VDIHEVLKFFTTHVSTSNFELFSEEGNFLKVLQATGMIEDPHCEGHHCSNCSQGNMKLCSNFCSQFQHEQQLFRNCIADSKIDGINVNFLKLNVSHSLDTKTNNSCNNANSLKCNRSSRSENYFQINNLDLNSDVEAIVEAGGSENDIRTAKEFRFKNVESSTHRLDTMIDNLFDNNHQKLLNL